MGCTIFWEAQEFSHICQDRCYEELLATVERAGWEYEVAEEELVAHVVNLDDRPDKARLVKQRLRLKGLTMFPFGRDEVDSRPRLSFVLDNTHLNNPTLRNRLVTLAPASYWLKWMPRLRDQYPVLSEQREQPIYGMRGDGNMRVRRTDLPGFIKFLNSIRVNCLPLLDIRTSDRLARKMINDIASKPSRSEKQPEIEAPEDICESLRALFSAPRYDDWSLALEAEDEIEREQNKANRAASMGSGSGSSRGRRKQSRDFNAPESRPNDTMRFRS